MFKWLSRNTGGSCCCSRGRISAGLATSTSHDHPSKPAKRPRRIHHGGNGTRTVALLGAASNSPLTSGVNYNYCWMLFSRPSWLIFIGIVASRSPVYECVLLWCFVTARPSLNLYKYFSFEKTFRNRVTFAWQPYPPATSGARDSSQCYLHVVTVRHRLDGSTSTGFGHPSPPCTCGAGHVILAQRSTGFEFRRGDDAYI